MDMEGITDFWYAKKTGYISFFSLTLLTKKKHPSRDLCANIAECLKFFSILTHKSKSDCIVSNFISQVNHNLDKCRFKHEFFDSNNY